MMLDVEPDEVVEAVGTLLIFNDQVNAQISHDEIAAWDSGAEAQAMARALLSDIEAARHMFKGGPGSDADSVLEVLIQRVHLRLKSPTIS